VNVRRGVAGGGETRRRTRRSLRPVGLLLLAAVLFLPSSAGACQHGDLREVIYVPQTVTTPQSSWRHENYFTTTVPGKTYVERIPVWGPGYTYVTETYVVRRYTVQVKVGDRPVYRTVPIYKEVPVYQTVRVCTANLPNGSCRRWEERQRLVRYDQVVIGYRSVLSHYEPIYESRTITEYGTRVVRYDLASPVIVGYVDKEMQGPSTTKTGQLPGASCVVYALPGNCGTHGSRFFDGSWWSFSSHRDVPLPVVYRQTTSWVPIEVIKQCPTPPSTVPPIPAPPTTTSTTMVPPPSTTVPPSIVPPVTVPSTINVRPS